MTAESSFYIPPPTISFRLKNYVTNKCIYSRTTEKPYFYHYTDNDYSDMYWKLVPGKGNRDGYYKLQNDVTGYYIFSRESQSPYFDHTSYPDADDQYWKLLPGSGKRSGYFRIQNLVTGKRIFSRDSQSPYFDHTGYTDADDQYWTFIFEDMEVDKVTYDLKKGVLTPQPPLELVRQTLENKTSSEQKMEFKLDQSTQHTTNFEYKAGFTISIGAKFKGGIPVVAETEISVDTSFSQELTFGKTSSFTKTYSSTIPVVAKPRTKVIGTFSVHKGNIQVPCTITMKSAKTGHKVDTHAVFSGITTWDLQHSLDEKPV